VVGFLIRNLLSKIGITTVSDNTKTARFGLDFRRRNAIGIVSSLQVDGSNSRTNSSKLAVNEVEPMYYDVTPIEKPKSSFSEYLFQAGLKSNRTAASFARCFKVPQNVPENAEGIRFEPGSTVSVYYDHILKKKPPFDLTLPAEVKILRPPEHGVLNAVVGSTPNDFHYVPEIGFEGEDRVMVEYRVGSIAVNIVYLFLIGDPDVSIWQKCTDKNREFRKISGQYSTTDQARAFSVSASNVFNFGKEGIVDPIFTFADLSNSELGRASFGDKKVIIDSNGAGHGWFVDATPESNDEFLPTADTNVFIAKAGSAAAGKMDMLSVLLHEYGHVLGIEHNADSRNFMSPVLQPGVRKLPTPDEMQLMANLVAELNATQVANAAASADESTHSGRLPLGLALGVPGIFGLLRRPELQRLSASWSVAGEGDDIEVASDQSDMLLAANSTLLNGSFAGSLTAGTWSAASWAVSGPVSPSVVTLNGVTLGEGSNRQASISQAFLVSPSDQFLSFTIKDELSRNANGPQDAFEVALLDAATGLPLLGTVPISKTDALLNRQFDGRFGAAPGAELERASSYVNRNVNANGSITYTLDLRSVNGQSMGRAVALSFDLISFGIAAVDKTSKITISDVKLVATPLPVDDSATLPEDTPTVIGVLSNDGNTAGFAPVVVTSPAHGTVTLGANGTLNYTPSANYFGQDSFTYALQSSNGQLSSTASVALTITAANDAPVVLSGNVSQLEDTAATLNLLASASDVDGDTLSTQIVSGPQYGTFVAQTNGNYLYTPAIDFAGIDTITYRVSDGATVSNIATLTISVTQVNDAPVLTARAVVVSEDTSLLIDPLSTAVDVEADVLTASVVTQPANGTLTLNANGKYFYTPNLNFSGEDAFTYRVSDGQLNSNAVTVAISVTEVNDAPTATNTIKVLAEDTTLAINLASLVADVDGDLLSLSIAATPAHGTLTLIGSGIYSYQPDANFFGADQFIYRVTDPSGATAQGTVSLKRESQI
jgi:VCBS repeat-containing protein